MSSLSFAATLLTLSALLPWAAVLAEESHIGALTGDAHRGKVLYRRYCIGCHGRSGDGWGENAPYLDPPARDFTAGVYKCRSTPTSSLPLDSDLFNTIGRGIHASAMPSWIALMRQQRADLVAYVKSFCPRFQKEKPQAVVPIPPEAPDTPESIARGKQVYEKMECWKCHGQAGKGNGPSASMLTDNKCGPTKEDLFRIFMTGLDGTPMPAYLGDLDADEAGDLVHFLRTLKVDRKN